MESFLTGVQKQDDAVFFSVVFEPFLSDFFQISNEKKKKENGSLTNIQSKPCLDGFDAPIGGLNLWTDLNVFVLGPHFYGAQTVKRGGLISLHIPCLQFIQYMHSFVLDVNTLVTYFVINNGWHHCTELSQK